MLKGEKMNKVLNFLDNTEFLNHTNYEQKLGQIFVEFCGEQWVERFCVLYLMYYKFDQKYPVFLEQAKETVLSNRPDIKSKEAIPEIIKLLDQVGCMYNKHPMIVRYLIPSNVISLLALKQHKGFPEIFDDYLNYMMEDKEKFVNQLIEYNILGAKCSAVLNYQDVNTFEININNTEKNSIFYSFRLNELDYHKDFLENLAVRTKIEKEHLIQYQNSENKQPLYPPNEINFNNLTLPVVLKFGKGMVWISLDMVETHKNQIPLDFDIAEVIEGAVLLDPLNIFKIINKKEKFKDMADIIKIIGSKKNKPLSTILKEYYENKYIDKREFKVDGYQIYKSFIQSEDSKIAKCELSRFNELIHVNNLNADKAKFILFYERMSESVPSITKPLILVSEQLDKLRDKLNSLKYKDE